MVANQLGLGFDDGPGTAPSIPEAWPSPLGSRHATVTGDTPHLRAHKARTLSFQLPGTHGVDPLELVYTERKPPTFTVTTEGIELLA